MNIACYVRHFPSIDGPVDPLSIKRFTPDYSIEIQIGDWYSGPISGWIQCGYLLQNSNFDIDGVRLSDDARPKEGGSLWKCSENTTPGENGNPFVEMDSDGAIFIYSGMMGDTPIQVPAGPAIKWARANRNDDIVNVMNNAIQMTVPSVPVPPIPNAPEKGRESTLVFVDGALQDRNRYQIRDYSMIRRYAPEYILDYSDGIDESFLVWNPGHCPAENSMVQVVIPDQIYSIRVNS